MADISRAIRETNDLFKRRSDPTFWAANLIDGSKSLKTPEQWTHYYAFISNPNNYDPSKIYKPMDPNETIIYDKHPNLKVERFGNGPEETIIHLKNMNLREVEDEKEEKE